MLQEGDKVVDGIAGQPVPGFMRIRRGIILQLNPVDASVLWLGNTPKDSYIQTVPSAQLAMDPDPYVDGIYKAHLALKEDKPDSTIADLLNRITEKMQSINKDVEAIRRLIG